MRLLHQLAQQVDALEAELSRLEPAELLLPDEEGWPVFLQQRTGIRRRAPWLFDPDSNPPTDARSAFAHYLNIGRFNPPM